MKNKRVILMILALAAVFYGQGTSGADSGPGLSTAAIPQETDAPVNGEVWVTNRLDIDFSKQLMTFIEIGADRCIPCKAMQPIMKDIAAAYSGRVQVVFYDVWKDPAAARKYQIQLIPTQVFIDPKGKEVFRHVGIFPKEEILALLKEHGIK